MDGARAQNNSFLQKNLSHAVSVLRTRTFFNSVFPKSAIFEQMTIFQQITVCAQCGAHPEHFMPAH